MDEVDMIDADNESRNARRERHKGCAGRKTILTLRGWSVAEVRKSYPRSNPRSNLLRPFVSRTGRFF